MCKLEDGLDFDKMSKEELIQILKYHYQKCIKPVDGYTFKVDRYYMCEQTGNDEVCFTGKGYCWLSFDEAREHFECK